MKTDMKRKIAAALVLLMCIMLALPTFAVTTDYINYITSLDGDEYGAEASSQAYTRLNDEAGLLDAKDFDTLNEKLFEISDRQKCDVIVVTVNSLDGKSAQSFADDYYDSHGYGYGSGKDGILLLLAMETRDRHITTTGFGITALTDAGIDYISDKILPELSEGNYYSAFTAFAEYCDDFITQAKTGDTYDRGNLPDNGYTSDEGVTGSDLLIMIPILIVAGALLAFIPVSIMKGKLKSVKMQAAAQEYMKQGSLNITESRDMFLYAHIDKHRKPEQSSGGSSTHIGSSGTTHGGGGGKF